MNEVNELVEWVAGKIVLWTCDGCEYQHKDAPHCNGDTKPSESCQYQFDQAKQILSHPDLALIDRDNKYDLRAKYWVKLDDGYWYPVIPISGALKEEKMAQDEWAGDEIKAQLAEHRLGRPNLLSDEEAQANWMDYFPQNDGDLILHDREILQAQREADIKHYEGMKDE